MLIALLPALTLATATPAEPTETITFDSSIDLDAVLTARLRSAIEAGWSLVDVSSEDDGNGIGFTLTREGDVERHVVVFDGTSVYRVGPGTLPAQPTKPSAFLLEALQGGGGVEIESTCGGYAERPYVVDGFAVGPEARELVARSLAAADDLESTWVSGRRAVFRLETDGSAMDLIVTLAEEGGGVAEAELRRYELGGGDHTVYRRRGALARALRHAFVSSIHQEGDSIVLRTSRGRFAIDPDGTAFRSRYEDGDHGGCGC